MAFALPNQADATHKAQAFITSTDLAVLGSADCVLSGCAVTQSANGPGMDVDTAAGYVRIAGEVVAVSQSLDDAVASGNATYPRVDLIEVGSDGTVDVTAGTPAADPVPPAVSAGHVALAFVFVDSSESTSVVTGDITDKRVLRPRRAVLRVPGVAADTATAVADGVQGVAVPAELAGCIVKDLVVAVDDAGTTGTLDVQLRRRRAGSDADVLSTKATVDTGEYSTATAATPLVVDAANDDLAEGDILYADIDAVHSGTAANGMMATVVVGEA